MRRREVIALIGGAPAWPFCAGAQQPDKIRLVAVVMPLAEGDREAEERKRVFERTLAGLGWAIGRNLRIDYRSATTNTDRSRHAAEITALAPDVIMTSAAQQSRQCCRRPAPFRSYSSTSPIR